MTKSIRGASGPVNSCHDLERSWEMSWPNVARRSSTSRMGAARRVGARRVGVELAPADLLQDRFRHDRPGGIVRADEEHVERWLHDRFLVDVVGKKPCQIAAQFRPPGATGLGQEAQELAQSDKTDGVDDLTALARRPDESRLLEGTRDEMRASTARPSGQPRYRRPSCPKLPAKQEAGQAGASSPAQAPQNRLRRHSFP